MGDTAVYPNYSTTMAVGGVSVSYEKPEQFKNYGGLYKTF